MVQSVLIDLNTDNGDAKPFGNLGLSLDDVSSFPDSLMREKIAAH